MPAAPRKRFIYLNDVSGGSATIGLLDPDIAEPTLARDAKGVVITRDLYQANVQKNARIGLRRAVLEEQGDGSFVETGEIVPMSKPLDAELRKHYRMRNGWNHDWPHLPTELEETEEHRARIQERLEREMAMHPYKFEVLALQRRYLWYLSDGGVKTQSNFISVVQYPRRYPYGTDGALPPCLTDTEKFYTPEKRDAGKPCPDGQPLLHAGPAWVVRFLVDDQVTAFGHCNVYLDDDGKFLCSDWCQRHDFESYGKGINLQVGIYTFDGWVVNSSISRAMSQGVFKPKEATIERTQVRNLLRNIPLVPTLSEALVNAERRQGLEYLRSLRDRVDAALAKGEPIDALVSRLTKEEQARWSGSTALSGTPILLEGPGNQWLAPVWPKVWAAQGRGASVPSLSKLANATGERARVPMTVRSHIAADGSAIKHGTGVVAIGTGDTTPRYFRQRAPLYLDLDQIKSDIEMLVFDRTFAGLQRPQAGEATVDGVVDSGPEAVLADGPTAAAPPLSGKDALAAAQAAVEAMLKEAAAATPTTPAVTIAEVEGAEEWQTRTFANTTVELRALGARGSARALQYEVVLRRPDRAPQHLFVTAPTTSALLAGNGAYTASAVLDGEQLPLSAGGLVVQAVAWLATLRTFVRVTVDAATYWARPVDPRTVELRHGDPLSASEPRGTYRRLDNGLIVEVVEPGTPKEAHRRVESAAQRDYLRTYFLAAMPQLTDLTTALTFAAALRRAPRKSAAPVQPSVVVQIAPEPVAAEVTPTTAPEAPAVAIPAGVVVEIGADAELQPA